MKTPQSIITPARIFDSMANGITHVTSVVGNVLHTETSELKVSQRIISQAISCEQHQAYYQNSAEKSSTLSQ